MNQRLANISRLGVKELRSLYSDPVMLFLILYVFTFAVYERATGATTDVRNAAVAIVDEDRSPLSRRIAEALREPYFRRPGTLAVNEIDTAMDAGQYTFVLDIPPKFHADLLAGHRPALQVNVDATAMSQAGTGANYIQNIVSQEIAAVLQTDAPVDPVTLVIRANFNPNLTTAWFESVTEIIINITLLALLLTGAAFIREREHGTLEHLLVMPLRPVEIMLAKVWANGLVIILAATLSLWVIVKGLLGVPLLGSIPLFVLGTAAYLFSVTGLGIFLATVVRSMPQFGLLAIPVFIIMSLLSGGHTPLDSMPAAIQTIMFVVPSSHFVSFAQAVLYRGAGFDIVWREFAIIATVGLVFFTGALLRFRASVAVNRD